jgi:Tol biopolymer transport system component
MRSNIASVRWVTTPMFSPDGHTLAYIAFSSDDYGPFGRHSALYTTQFSDADQQLQAGKPQLLATATTHFIELGPWLNDHQLTFYSDGSLYAVDTSAGKVAAITSTGGTYTRIVGVVDRSIMGSEQDSEQP